MLKDHHSYGLCTGIHVETSKQAVPSIDELPAWGRDLWVDKHSPG